MLLCTIFIGHCTVLFTCNFLLLAKLQTQGLYLTRWIEIYFDVVKAKGYFVFHG